MTLSDQPTTLNRASVAHRALAHPSRARMLALLRAHEMSPSELARETGDVVGVAAYHVRVLLEAGLVELVRTAPNRGAVQHFYRATNAAPVGEVLMLSEQAAAELVDELRAVVGRARLEPGDVPVIVVAHHD